MSSKWHVQCPLLRLFRRVCPRKRAWAVCRNMLAFYSDNYQHVAQLPSWRTIPRLSVTVYSIYLKQPFQRKGRVPARRLRKRRTIVTGTHINPGIFRVFTVMFWLLSDWASFWDVLSESGGNGQWRNDLGGGGAMSRNCTNLALLQLEKVCNEHLRLFVISREIWNSEFGCTKEWFCTFWSSISVHGPSVLMRYFVSNVDDCLY